MTLFVQCPLAGYYGSYPRLYKAQQFEKDPKADDSREPEQASSHSLIKITSFDLSNLVESVVEGIYAGHDYRSLAKADKSSPEQARSFHQEKVVRLTPPSMNQNVMIIFDIERQLNWLPNSQIGAWKGILNKLVWKRSQIYRGWICSGFSLRTFRQIKTKFACRHTGNPSFWHWHDAGLCEHRLYTPFAQEDPVSVDTRLGLSIVRQLVNDLNGTISIDSEAGYGNLSQSLRPFEYLIIRSAGRAVRWKRRHDPGYQNLVHRPQNFSSRTITPRLKKLQQEYLACCRF
jgi:hypothetical protein